jgi:hypothetical protein
VEHLAAARAEVLDDLAGVLARHLDHRALDRLAQLAVDFLEDDLRLADGELEALAAHVLGQHAEVHDAAALDLVRVGVLGLVETAAPRRASPRARGAPDLAAGDELALLAGEGRVVDEEGHRDRRLLELDRRQRVLHVGGHSVSPILSSSTPPPTMRDVAGEHLGRGLARLRPSKRSTCLMLVSTADSRSGWQIATRMPGLSVPRYTRPMPMRPRKSSWSRVAPGTAAAPSSSCVGPGTCSRIMSNRGFMSFGLVLEGVEFTAKPERPEP